MKKFSHFQQLFLFFVIFGISLLCFGTTLAVSGGIYLENTRLRETPSLKGNILSVVPAHTTVLITEEKDDWYKVKLKSGSVGWSMKTYVRSETVKENNEEKIVASEKVTVGKLLFASRIRKTPFLVDNIIEILPQGTLVKVLTVRPEWYRVEYNGTKTGWVMAELVSKGPSVAVSEEKVLPQGGVPVGVDLAELNQYWLERVNALREKKNLRLLVLDQRWIDTATEWAAYMGRLGSATHTRPDGKSMHAWIDTKGLDFTVRKSEGGWQTNYFTENIAWGIASPTTVDVKRVLDNTMTFFLGEASSNGDHYRTLYHPDWNSVGVGFFFKDQGNGKYKVFIAMHYGSLQIP